MMEACKINIAPSMKVFRINHRIAANNEWDVFIYFIEIWLYNPWIYLRMSFQESFKRNVQIKKGFWINNRNEVEKKFDIIRDKQLLVRVIGMCGQYANF